MTTYLTPDPTRRTPVRFPGPVAELAGHLYRPPVATADERTPAVALCGPISSVKEQTLPHYAERLADAGYTGLIFDPTGFGESDGTPRGRYDPHRVIDDYAAAVNQRSAGPTSTRAGSGSSGCAWAAATRSHLVPGTSG